jgi:hypothetical protein
MGSGYSNSAGNITNLRRSVSARNQQSGVRSVAAIAASGAGHPAAVQLTRHESGHFYVAKSGHFNLAITICSVDNYDYVKYETEPET